jgi:flagellar biosynthesis/type III secretory pathway chaperone
MNPDASFGLAEVLDQELEAARQLAATLQSERRALTGTSSDAVTEQAAIKTGWLQRIEALEAERRKRCDAANVTMRSEPYLGRWTELMALVAECRTANEVNGYIINARQGQVRQLINLVRGGAPATYGPQGKTSSRALRALAQA